MASLTAYLDDSGTHDESPLTFVGGAIASKSQWLSMQAHWKAVLKKYAISEFHSNDCEGGHGPFKGWPREKRDSLTFTLSQVIKKQTKLIIAIGVRREPFLRVANELEVKADPYQLCVETCLYQISEWGLAAVKRPPIAVVIEKGAPYDRFIIDCYKRGVTESDLRERFKLYSIDHQPKNELLPLQIADFIIYETFLFHKRFRYEGVRGIRRSCENLYTNAKSKGIVMEESLIRDVLIRSEKWKTEIRKSKKFKKKS